MIRVQLAGAADFAALFAAYAPPCPERTAGAEEGWAEEARPAPRRVGRGEDEAGRVKAALGVVR